MAKAACTRQADCKGISHFSNCLSMPNAPPDYDALVVAVQKIAQATGRIKLNRKTLVILLADLTKVSRKNIVAVLDGLEGLEAHYFNAATSNKEQI